jgi:hypothetical protein
MKQDDTSTGSIANILTIWRKKMRIRVLNCKSTPEEKNPVPPFLSLTIQDGGRPDGMPVGPGVEMHMPWIQSRADAQKTIDEMQNAIAIISDWMLEDLEAPQAAQTRVDPVFDDILRSIYPILNFPVI